METISLIRPDDWHCHLRDASFLTRTVDDISRTFARAIVMPNLANPITHLSQAQDYKKRILAHLPAQRDFSPLMTLYLNEELSQETLREAKSSGIVTACKLYPAGATTHSSAGVKKLSRIYPLLECMQEIDLPLLIHGESIDPKVDIFDREEQFIDEDLRPLLCQFPQLRVVLEHISTQAAVDFVLESPANLAATITAHHLWFNRNILLSGGIRPHYYCMPILKRQSDQKALIKAATSANSKFFLGTDSAPHAQARKENSCGCAGVYSAHAAIEFYAQIFEEYQALPQLEKFASLNGPAFYRLPVNATRITLKKTSWTIPKTLSFGEETLIPMLAGETLSWQIVGSEF
jgi:dihydroorotase